MDTSNLLKKINDTHNEVRIRALKNISFKLSYDLLRVEDLVHERAFLINLLEWFNFPNCSHEKEALELMAKLVKHGQGVATLVSVGGVEFLCQLRQHSCTSLHSLIDGILEDLMKLPSTGSLAHSPASRVSSSTSMSHDCHMTPPHGIVPVDSNGETFTTEDTSDVGPLSSIPPTFDTEGGNPAEPPISSGGGAGTRPMGWKYDGLGSMSAVTLHEKPAPATTAAEEGDLPLFPWIPLTKNDQQVLSVTNQRLSGQSDEETVKNCNFVKDVLFQDFPPELFLQRPNIVRSLMRLVVCEDGAVTGPALECCLQLLHRLKGRLEHSDSILIKGETSQVERSGGLAGGGHEMEVCTPEVLQLVKRDHLTVRALSLSLLSGCVQLLTGLVNEGVSDTMLLVIECMHHCTDLLKVDSRTCQTSTDHKLQSALQEVMNLLSHCLSKWRRLSTAFDLPGVGLSEGLVHLTLAVAVTLAHLMEDTDPGVLESVLTSQSVALLEELVLLPHLVLMQPQVCLRLASIVEQLYPDMLKLLRTCLSMGDCLRDMVLMHERPATDKRPPATDKRPPASDKRPSASDKRPPASDKRFPDPLKTLEKMKSASHGLHFKCDTNYLEKCISCCIDNMSCDSSEVSGLAEAQLLNLLSHTGQQVKAEVYCQLEVWLQEERDVTVEALSSCEVVSELVTFGLHNLDEKVSGSARMLVSAVLGNSLSNNDLSLFKKLWPYLQVGVSQDELSHQVRNILKADSDSSMSKLDRVKGSLRLMFSRGADTRVWGLSNLLKLVVMEMPSAACLRTTPSALLHDLLVDSSRVKGPPVEHLVRGTSSFQKSSVTKLVEVVTSQLVDVSLRTTALDQLAQVLQDYSLHKFAVEEGILEFIFAVIEQVSANGRKCQEWSFYPSCVAILRYLAHGMSSLREDLSGNHRHLLLFVSSMFSAQDHPSVLFNCIKLLSNLIFNEVGYFICPTLGREFALPTDLLNKLQFPFPVDEQQKISNHTTHPPLDPALYFNKPVRSMLSLMWHLASAGGTAQLTTHRSAVLERGDSLLLPLSQLDIQLLTEADLSLKMRTLLFSMSSTSRVEDTSSMVLQLHLCLLTAAIGGVDVLSKMDMIEQWKSAMEKFLLRSPSTLQETSLLCDVLNLSLLLRSTCPNDPHLLEWLGRVTLQQDSPVLQLLSNDETSRKQTSDLVLNVLSFFTRLISEASTGEWQLVPLVIRLVSLVEGAGSASYYTLPLLERGLLCLHTALKTNGWHGNLNTTVLYETLKQLSNILTQILKAFITSHGEEVPSFMGKGVTKNAAYSLLHVISAALSLCQVDPVEVLGRDKTDWILGVLHSLLCDRDTLIASCGYCIMSVLCCNITGTTLCLSSILPDPFGLAGLCLEAVLTDTLPGTVHDQACSVLLNITVQCHREGQWDQLLVLQTTQGEVVKGLNVMVMMLEQFQFVSHVIKWMSISMVTPELQEKVATSYRALDGRVTDMDHTSIEEHLTILEKVTENVKPSYITVLASLLASWIAVLPSNQMCQWIENERGLASMTQLLWRELLSLLVAFHSEKDVRMWCVMWRHILRCLGGLVSIGNNNMVTWVLEKMDDFWKFLEPLLPVLHLEEVCLLVVEMLRVVGAVCLICSAEQKEDIVNVLQTNWEIFKDLLVRGFGRPALRSVLLPLLCVLLKQRLDGRGGEGEGGTSQQTLLLEALDTPSIEEDSDGLPAPLGGYLVSKLLALWEPHATLGTSGVEGALTLVLAASSTAKTAALKDGLLETCVTELQTTYSQLCVESSKPRSKHPQEERYIDRITSVLTILKNFTYKSDSIKSACLHGNLLKTLYQLWPWTAVNDHIEMTVIGLLGTLTANHIKACSSLVSVCQGSTSLVHCILRHCHSHCSRYGNTVRSGKIPSVSLVRGVMATFRLVGNLVLSLECRRILKKVNFLSNWSTIHPKSDTASPSRARLVHLWLYVLNNLTLSHDGQQMVAMTTDALEILLLLWQHGDAKSKNGALMVLHNISFLQPIKAQLADKGSFVSMLYTCITSGNVLYNRIGHSALRALTFGCARANIILKKHSEFHEVLQANLKKSTLSTAEEQNN